MQDHPCRVLAVFWPARRPDHSPCYKLRYDRLGMRECAKTYFFNSGFAN